MAPHIQNIGRLPDGTPAQTCTIGPQEGLQATLLNWGARLSRIDVLLAGGGKRNVLLGYKTLEEWGADTRHIGATAGRVCNRVSDARFSLDGQEFRLSANKGPNTLHGGAAGFGRRGWSMSADGEAAVLTLDSEDGDQGFPGALHTTIRHSIEGDTLRLDYTATTTRPTVVNLTNHAYFNLAGGGDVLGHVLETPADRYLVADAALIPSGEIRSVAGTVMDFRTPTALGARIEQPDEMLKFGGGYDVCLVLPEAAPSAEPRLAARLRGGGLALEVLTTEPAIQLYTGNGLHEDPFPHFGACCLESQHYPNSPNRPGFPSVVLRPGETYRQTTLWRFRPAE